MAIYKWSTEISTIYKWNTSLSEVYKGSTKIWQAWPTNSYFCLTANTAGSTVKLDKVWSPSSRTFEISSDWENRTTYTIWDIITLSNVWDRVYWKNTSSSLTGLSDSATKYYKFIMTWSISASWDAWYLVNKNSRTTLYQYCFCRLFLDCTSLTTAPRLPADTLWTYCYYDMFKWCTNLVSAPNILPAEKITTHCYHGMFSWCTSLTKPPVISATTTSAYCCRGMFENCVSLNKLPQLHALRIYNYSYAEMFKGCSQIKLSSTQTWEYQNEYRIPTTWTWIEDSATALSDIFTDTWWTFAWPTLINTTYYTSNTTI